MTQKKVAPGLDGEAHEAAGANPKLSRPPIAMRSATTRMAPMSLFFSTGIVGPATIWLPTSIP
jgi:hypothetical protein